MLGDGEGYAKGTVGLRENLNRRSTFQPWRARLWKSGWESSSRTKCLVGSLRNHGLGTSVVDLRCVSPGIEGFHSGWSPALCCGTCLLAFSCCPDAAQVVALHGCTGCCAPA